MTELLKGRKTFWPISAIRLQKLGRKDVHFGPHQSLQNDTSFKMHFLYYVRMIEPHQNCVIIRQPIKLHKLNGMLSCELLII